MPRDYARPTNRKKSKKTVSHKPWRWFFTGVMVGMGLIVGGYLYVTTLGVQHSKTILAKLKPEVKTKHKPTFDYYSMLPQMKVPGDEEKTHHAKQPVVAGDVYYMIQVASFAQKKDAEKMKAELLLGGYNVSVNVFSKGATTWYRVMLGPYNRIATAQSDQRRLADGQIDTLLLTMHSSKKT